MRKILLLLIGAVFFFSFTGGCASKAPKPSKVVKQYYGFLFKKQFSKAYDLILPENPPAITKERYIKELEELDKNFQLKEVKVVEEEVKGDRAEVTLEITEVDKNRGVVITSQAKVSLKLKNSRWYIVWPKKGRKEEKGKKS